MERQVIVQSTGQDDNNRIFKIQLTNRSITTIVGLKEYQKLRCLNLSYNLIQNIQNLHTLNDLRQLHLENNSISRIGGLDSNKNLQVINLANNRIEKIENIAHLIKLETLILNNNQVSKLSGLEYLKQLKTLSVRKNHLESIETLPTFSKLSTLLLSHNSIKAVSNNVFMSSKSLTSLDLSHNLIGATIFLQYLPNLQGLNLSHNCIKELQVPPMLNLQSLNISFNQIGKLPPLAVCFPELVALDVSYNVLCSEIQLLSALTETVYLTELDFRQNPMCNQTFQSALQRIHSFDFLNDRAMSKAGAKYYQKVAEIQADLYKNRQAYGIDDEKDREIKMSGFFDQELQFQMSGLRSNRPSSPKKRRNLQKATFYDDIDRSYHQFVENDKRIKVIREHYLKVCGQYNIVSSQHILTELPADIQQPNQTIAQEAGVEDKKKEDRKYSNSQQLHANQAEIRKENQKNSNKWKQLKNREKTFKIRDVIKSRGKDSSINRGHGSTTNTNWNNNIVGSLKPDKQKSELFKTQMLPRKTDDLFKTMNRPSSMRKKE